MFSKISDRSARIAIVGAGPAGIMAAVQLTKAGYKNINILEKSKISEGGSKVRTLRLGKSIVETGPIQVGIGHKNTNFWLDYLGLATFEPHHAFVLRRGEQAQSHRILTSAQEFVPWQERIEIAQEGLRFKQALDEFNEIYPEIKNIPKNSKYSVSFKEFCEHNNFLYFHEMYKIYTSAYGYGITSEIPAFKVLRTFDASFGLVFWLYAGMNLKMIDKGFGGLMDGLVDRFSLASKIKFDQNIIHIKRLDNKIYITTPEHKEEYDYLIIACPIDKIYSALGESFSLDERELFENLHYSPYHVLVADVPKLPRGGFVLPEKFNLHGTLQMMSKNSVDGDEVVLYIPQISSIKAKDILAHPYLLPKVQESIDAARRDLGELGFEITNVHDSVAWNQYNPHFVNPEIYSYCESVQGKNNTFYVGTMCQPIDYVDLAFEHATKIVSENFEGEFFIPEQGVSVVANWHSRAANRYSAEQLARSPSQWHLSLHGYLGEW